MWILWAVLSWTILSMPLAILAGKAMKRASEAYDECEPKEAHPIILPRDAVAALAILREFRVGTVNGQEN